MSMAFRRLWPPLLASLLSAIIACKEGDRADQHAEHSTAPQPSTPAADPAAHAAHGPEHSAAERPEARMAPAPAGYAPFQIDVATARAVGLRTASVAERPFAKSIRTSGVVVVDETRTSHVHAKVRGWIESVSVDFVGRSVARGARLCSIYSQEVLAAQLEFLSVLKQASRSAELSGPFADAEKQARKELLSAARRRLSLWDVPAEDIERLERTRSPQRTFDLRAPRSGVVIAKQAVAGLYVDPSVELYLISDLEQLWVLADIYESDAAGMTVGTPARVSVAGLPEPISARVAFLPPTIEETTRTLKVRFDLKNPKGQIRPGAFATVEIELAGGSSLSIPEDAVIHAGPQDIVFVVSGSRVEPRGVTLGPPVAGFYSVRSGLEAGELVAVGAQFLIDSESRLRATTGPGPSHAGH